VPIKRIFTNMRFYILLVLYTIPTLVFSQSKQDIAMQKSVDAVRFLDDKQYDSALILFTQAAALDPANIDYPYEMAYCHYSKGNHKAAIIILEKLIKKDTLNDQVYQLLGNSYDNEFDHDKAIMIYKKGLEKYPTSGPLYSELGTVYLAKNELNTALNYFEKGIEVEPTYYTNYQQATKLFCASDNKIWGLLYGEVLLNMDRSSNKAQVISKLLFDTYYQNIVFKNGAFSQIQFNKTTIVANKKESIKKTYPEQYLRLVIEPTLREALANTTQISIADLIIIRKKFAELYAANHTAENPNILFAYHTDIMKAGHWDSYNYWLFNKGNTAEFKSWIDKNREEFKKFLAWYKNNPLVIDDKHTMYRTMYR
jgi:tetratricopeptide (TPR) repeat protein